MDDRKHPCDRGLTPECFKKYPAWAKRAFAYRLMHALLPARITKRLPGFEKPPGFLWDPIWTPWDPWPPGEVLPPDTPDDPPADGPVPPIYVPPWEPGPPHRPSPSPIAGGYEVVVGSTTDGEVRRRETSWATVHSPGMGYLVNRTNTADMWAARVAVVGSYYYIQRSFFFFDLSEIETGITVKEVTLSIAGIDVATNDVTIQEGTQSAPLSVFSYDDFTGDYFDKVTWQLSETGGVDLNVFTFNDDGIAYVQSVLGSVAKFCAREYDHDYAGVDPGAAPVTYNNGICFAEWDEEALKPTLAITY